MEDMWLAELDEIELMCGEALGLGEGDLRRIKMMRSSREDMLLHGEVESTETEGGQVAPQPQSELEAEDIETEMGDSEIEAPITRTEADFGLSEECGFPVPECPFAAGLAREIENAFGVSDENLPIKAEETEYVAEGEMECAFLAETAREIERAFGASDDTPSQVAELDSVEAGCSDSDNQYQLGYEEMEDEDDEPLEPERQAGKLFSVTGEDLFSTYTSFEEEGPVLLGPSGENLFLHEEEECIEAEHDEEVTPVGTVEEVTRLLAISSGGDVLLLGEGKAASAESGDVDEEYGSEVHVEELDPMTQADMAVLAYAFDQMGKMTRFCG
jgi:hypothetical protein